MTGQTTDNTTFDLNGDGVYNILDARAKLQCSVPSPNVSFAADRKRDQLVGRERQVWFSVCS